MIVNYINNKKVDFKEIEYLLEKSKRMNTYTNNGPVKYALERELEKLLEIKADKKVVCVNNGTSALHVLLYLYKQKYGDLKWGSSSFTFPSVICNDTKMSLFDEPEMGNSWDIKEWKDYDGLIITNLFGTRSDLTDFVSSTCANEGKLLIFDNASSPMSKVGKTNICNFGNASFGSLHHTKYLGFGEGGFLVVPEEDYEKALSITNFGFEGNRVPNKFSSNFKMSEVSAAFCLHHINNFDLEKHFDIQMKLIKRIKNISGVELFRFSSGVLYGNLPLLFDNPQNIDDFRSLDIEANKYYRPLTNGHKNSWDIYDRIVNLPLHADIDDYQIDYMIKIIKIIAKENGKL